MGLACGLKLAFLAVVTCCFAPAEAGGNALRSRLRSNQSEAKLLVNEAWQGDTLLHEDLLHERLYEVGDKQRNLAHSRHSGNGECGVEISCHLDFRSSKIRYRRRVGSGKPETNTCQGGWCLHTVVDDVCSNHAEQDIVDMAIWVQQNYQPAGESGSDWVNGARGPFLCINLKSGTSAAFKALFFHRRFMKYVKVPSVFWSIFDIDGMENTTERVHMSGFHNYTLSNDSSVAVSVHTGLPKKVGLWSTEQVTEADNPAHPVTLTPLQKKPFSNLSLP